MELQSICSDKLPQVVRNGRIKKVTKTKIIFTSGKEMDTRPNTLFVDCSTNRWLDVAIGDIWPSC